jgi:hypothetical protein
MAYSILCQSARRNALLFFGIYPCTLYPLAVFQATATEKGHHAPVVRVQAFVMLSRTTEEGLIHDGAS